MAISPWTVRLPAVLMDDRSRRRLIDRGENSRPRRNMAGCGQSARRSPPSRRHTTSASGGRRWRERRSIDAPTAGPERGMLKTLRGTAHFFDRQHRLEPHRLRAQPHHHHRRRRRALPHPARHRSRRADRRDRGDRLAHPDHRRRLRRRRLSDADLLRSVRAAHHRPHRNPVPGRGAGRLHQLRGRATMSAPACSPAARCATASIPPGA